MRRYPRNSHTGLRDWNDSRNRAKKEMSRSGGTPPAPIWIGLRGRSKPFDGPYLVCRPRPVNCSSARSPAIGRLSRPFPQRVPVPTRWPRCACQNKLRAPVTHRTRGPQTGQYPGGTGRACLASGMASRIRYARASAEKCSQATFRGQRNAPNGGRELSTRARRSSLCLAGSLGIDLRAERVEAW